jgi:hypothetical protein
MKTSSPPKTTITPVNFRPLRRLCGLGIAAIGLSALIASAQATTIPVANGNFETEYGSNTDKTTNWVKLTGWSLENTVIGSVPIAGAFSSSADGGSKFTRFTWNDAGAEQDLNRTVAVGDTLSVTFNFGRATNRWGGSNNTGVAYFKIGSQYYYQDCDVSGQTAGTWKSFTFTTTATNAGALILGFRVARTTANNQYASLDGVSDVTLTPAANDPNMPTSTNATLAALENTATALTESDFGYADPNSSPLAAVQITSLPALGTLKNGGATVVSGDLPLTVAAANIGNLTYLSPLGGFGSPYTTIGIKVQDSDTPTGLWSLPATMTVNVTHVNHAPTSTGGAVAMSVRAATSMTFAASNFQFSDVDAGNTLQAIKVTSLPLNGALNVALDTEIPVADIGTLTYTPTPGYTGPDSFDFQVSDGALFSANAIMAISVTTDILVQDGSFETPGAYNGINPFSWAGVALPWTHSAGIWGQVKRTGTTLPDNGGGTWVANINDAVTTVISQPLGSYSFIAGDTLTVTFDVGRTNYGGGVFEALFRVNGVELLPQSFNNTAQAVNTWATDTLTAIIPNAVTDGALTLEFRWVSGRVGDLDKVSNVSVGHVGVDPNAPTSNGATLAALENTATALAAGDFGYANTANPASLLAAVQIIELPALGTLKNGGATVLSGDLPLTVAAADIGNLSYLSPLGGFGTNYTTIGIKVQNSDTPTGLWSLPAIMTVNVTHVNHAPTSTGGAVIMSVRAATSMTFAASNFQFSDVDAGNTLQAIKVKSTPLHGTLSVAVDTEILVADIGTLTYTPTPGYTGADSFEFQVSDGALFSADATMAISVTTDILVLNGSFETPDAALWWTNTGAPWTDNGGGYGRVPASVNGYPSAPGGGVWIANMNDGPNPANNNWPGNIITQPLGSQTLNAGATLQMTFYLYRNSSSGVLQVSFLNGTTTLASQDIDTSTQDANTWKLYTFSQTILTGVTADLHLKFHNVGGKVSWLDKVSNVSVSTGSGPTPGSFADWASVNSVTGGVDGDSNKDGVQNGIAYFMGVTGPATNPGLNPGTNTVTWPMSATFSGTYVVETSTDLGAWTPAATQPTRNGDGNLVFTLPPDAPGGKSFVRLVVTPN